MSKMFWFLTIVILGVFGVLLISNQGQSKYMVPDFKLNISPTTPPIVDNQPSVSPPPSTSASVSTPPATSESAQQSETSTAVIATSKGNIVLTLYDKEAPKTVENFILKAKSGFYNNLTFHRVEDWVTQGGDPKGNGTGGGVMLTELNDKPFTIGSLGVARGQDIKISNDAQFFITKKEASWLNNQYTNFGIVREGIDVVNKLEIGDKILTIQIL